MAENLSLDVSGEGQGGLLAKAEDPAALLPRSGYEKTQDVKAMTTAIVKGKAGLRLRPCSESQRSVL